MKTNEIITERFINLHSPDQKRAVIDDIIPMLNLAYKNVDGGLGNIDPENLINTPGIWKLVRKDGEFIGGKLYRDYKGRKTRLTLHNGSQEGRAAVKSIMQTDMNQDRSWTEASGAVEKVLLRKGGKPVSNKEAGKILGKEILELDPDGFHYTREVAPGRVKRLIIIGTVS